MKILIRNIMKSATNENVENLELDQLKKNTLEKLKWKKVLACVR